MSALKDPYEVFDEWREYEAYNTYVKCYIWISDGEIVEEHNSYKEVPESIRMSNGKYSTHWMFPTKRIDPFGINEVPLPPFKK